MTRKMELAFSLMTALGWAAVIGGCGKSASEAVSQPAPPRDSTSADASTASDAEVDEHGHKPGTHGGVIVSLGRDSYHVEAVFEAGNRLRLYTLGQDESRVIDVERQTLRGFVKGEGETESLAFTLEPEPQEGDADGRTSQFVGILPENLAGGSLQAQIGRASCRERV